MRLSVIIPALNENATIGCTVERVRSSGVEEVIVVDGGSTDGTPYSAAKAGACVLQSEVGRGTQQNKGAQAATGDTLLFLHADTALPEDFPRRVAATLALPGVAAGAFRLRLDAKGFGYGLVERMVDLRCRFFQLPFGDQGIFLPRKVFEAAGGFPGEPILEDYELIRRVRRLGRVAIADGDAVTSARRWRRKGVLRTTFDNQVCLLAYRLRVAPVKIARWRGL